MTYRRADVLEVGIWGSLVGAIAQDPATGRFVFEYSPEWREHGVELSPLRMPRRPEPYYLAQWPELSRESYHDLPPLLADSLPDAFGNALVDAWMAEHDVPKESITPLDRLAYVADRAMGALEFRPPARALADEPTSAVDLAELVLAARLTVNGRLADSQSAHAALQQLIQVGSSPGGARAKALVAFRPRDYRVLSPFAPLEAGFEHWLVKLDGVSATGMDGHGGGLGDAAPYGRIEYAYYEMAVAAGVTMSECRLLAEGPRLHFMTRRFDRGPGGERYHVLSLSAMAHLDYRLVGAHSYDQYLQVVRELGLSLEDLRQAYRRMVFNVLAVNRDDHAKNFAFLLRSRGPWELAPAFDVTHAYRSDSEWTSRHNLMVNGRLEGITVADLEAVGARHEVPGYRKVIREVAEAIAQWPRFASDADLDPATTQAIARDLASPPGPVST